MGDKVEIHSCINEHNLYSYKDKDGKWYIDIDFDTREANYCMFCGVKL